MSASRLDRPFERLALIGIGLIGSSLAQVVRQRGLAKTIAIATRRQETLEEARSLNLGDIYTQDPAEAVEGADLVILCVPVGANRQVTEAMAAALSPGAIVSDVGSVKKSVLQDVGPLLPDAVHFVPGHPVAGTEHSGPSAGFADLFDQRWCILTPPTGTDPAAVSRLEAFWQGCGSMVEIMDADHHDKVLAITSHLPHLIAYTIVGTASDLEASTREEVVKFSAGGFRDFTRIAASDPVMWRDIFLNNSQGVLEMLQRFSEDLTALQRAIRWGQGDTLEQFFERTREIRSGIVDAHQAGHFDPRERDDDDPTVP